MCIYIYIYIYTYVCVCVYICMCVCVCVCIYIIDFYFTSSFNLSSLFNLLSPVITRAILVCSLIHKLALFPTPVLHLPCAPEQFHQMCSRQIANHLCWPECRGLVLIEHFCISDTDIDQISNSNLHISVLHLCLTQAALNAKYMYFIINFVFITSQRSLSTWFAGK